MTRALQIRAWGHQQSPGLKLGCLQGKNNSVLQEGSNTSPAATRTKRPTLDKTHPKLHVCLKRNLPTHSNLPQFYTVDYFCCINKGYSRMLPRGFMRLIILKQKSIIISSPVRPIKVSWHVFEIWLINIQNVTKGQLHANGFVGFVKLFVELAKVRLQSLFKIKNHSFKQDRQSILLPGNSLSKYCRRGKKTMAAGCLADKSLPCGFIYFIYMHITMHVAGRWKELNTVKQGNMRAGGRPLKHRFTDSHHILWAALIEIAPPARLGSHMSQHHTVHTVRIPATSAAPPYPVEQAPVTSVVFFPLHLLWDSAEGCWEEKTV